MRVFRWYGVVMFVVLVIFLFPAVQNVQAAGPTVIAGNITMPTTWIKEQSPYVVSTAITASAPLIIEPGVVVKFNNNATNNLAAGIFVQSDFSALGTEDEKIVFTSVCDDAYGGDTKSYSTKCNSGPVNSEWGGISLYETSAHATIEYALFSRASRGISYQAVSQNLPYREVRVKHTEMSQCSSAIFLRNTIPTLSFNIFEGNTYGVEVVTDISDRIPVVRDSSFINNGVAIKVSYPGTVNIDARFNWWGDATGPYFQSANPVLDNSNGRGNQIIQSFVDFRPWLESEPSSSLSCTDCASNVLFLPGIKGSKLYKDDGSKDGDTLWLPTILSNDLDELSLDENGRSVHTVYTKDVLSTIPFGSLYQSFLQKLDTLKNDGTINGYQSFAYDWRQNIEDIVSDGVLYPQGVLRKLATDAEVLARSSKTRKVTIIAHSNGGLLAKALMLELEKRGLEGNIETIIFVGTPQMGTPLSLLSLLYGYDEPIPALMSQSRARTLAENMPGAYGLLPSEEYFHRMVDPFITFSSHHTRYKKLLDAYGDGIDDYWEMYSFLHGDDDGRDKPVANDIESENILNGTLMDQARNTHSRLDAWLPPAGVSVVEIAGWGLDTVSGVSYTEKSLAKCYYSGTSVPSCVNEGKYEPIYDPQFTVDGDAVVTAPSALMLSESAHVKRYWVDLHENNKGLRINRQHRDLLEIDSVQEFLSHLLTKNTTTPLPSFFSTTRPDDHSNAKPRLRMALYSPLDIHLYDTKGNHTGPKRVVVDGQDVTIFEEGIPNSYYYQFGERKYVGWSKGENIRVEMDGYDLGAFTLKLSEVEETNTGEKETTHTMFESLPTTADTVVRFSIPETGIVGMPPLVADIDTEDGVKRYSVTPVINGVAILGDQSDIVPPATTPTISSTQGTNGWYTSDVTVTLKANDNDGGSGVEKTEYSIDNGMTWNVYTQPFVITQEGTTTVQFFSTDKAGNKEAIQNIIIKIDKTAPEGKIAFNTTTQKLEIIGKDNLSGNVSVVVIEQKKDIVVTNGKMKRIRSWFEEWWRKNKRNLPDMLATLTDEAGHTTSITFEKSKDRRGRLFVKMKSLGYDQKETTLMNALAEYKWLVDRKNQYHLLATHLRSDTRSLESHYIQRKNETWIMERPKELADDDFDDDSERRPVIKKLPGLIVPYLETNQGRVLTQY